MPTHASLQHNFHIFQDCTECDSNMTAVCFLTHFHVMGLICHYLFVPYCGGTGYFMSPAMFVGNPGLWIEALSKYKGTFCMVPNFALDLAAAANVPPNTDLSSLHFLSNGSESVSIDTMKRFRLKFAPHGLQKHTLRAFYGLSEHTVHLCASTEELFIKSGQVGNGRPHSSVTVKAVNPNTHTEVEEGAEGEIWIHSESKALGYWGKEEASKETFHAKLVGDKERTYLRTGDMGFILSGSVFIAGRMKNLVVFSGRKIYMNDIENRVESLFSELRSGRTVAVEWDSTLASTPSQTSRSTLSPTQCPAPRRGIGFFAELQKDCLQATECHMLAEKIAARIGIDFRVETLLVALLPLQMMPHTGSGKRQRPLCKTNLLNGTLQVVCQWSPSTMRLAREAQSAREAHAAIKPEFIPLPSTPLTTTEKTTAAVQSAQTPKLSSTVQTTPPKLPTLELESSPQLEDMGVIPRKESRFCLEDAPPALHTCMEPTAETAPFVDQLAVPDTAPKERGEKLMGQEKTVIDIISKVLGVGIEMDTNIWAHGCDSVKAIQISGRLEQCLGFSVEAHFLYAYQTPRALLEKLKRTLLHLCSPVNPAHSAATRQPESGPLPCNLACKPPSRPAPICDRNVAIIGMACKFPGCDSPEELWKLLMEKTVAITHLQEPLSGRWIHGGFTQRMACFDHKWFGVSKMEASRMDPQQSILLHTAWECLHRSGYDSPDEVKGSKIGVFIGFWGSDAHALSLAADNPPPCTGYAGALTANRISYVFDLKGPSMVINTACAASLTALDVAVTYIHQGKCSQALVGGVNALLDYKMFQTFSSMGMLAPKGESCVFDIGASGFVRGEGCGMVMLKRVGDALKDGDRIHAVLKSVETHHNGTAATLTAPNKYAQMTLLRTSLSSARMGPNDVSYMEAHGTGTPLGDPMEMDAIQQVFGQPKAANKIPRVGPLIVGSIKANIGHLEAGAGIAGLIKTVLVLEHAKAPSNPGLKTTNPALKIDPAQILLPRETVGLDEHYMYGPENHNLLCAGVNSFGIGGAITNALVQQYSQLPHLARVKCSLVLGGEFGSVTKEQVMGIIQLLRARLTSFNDAYLSCIEAFQRAVKPVKVLMTETYYHHPAYLMFCLLYSTVRTLEAHDVEISFLLGTNMCAEVVSLAIANVLILSDAMRLLLAGMVPHLFNIKFIVEEEMLLTTSFLSPTLNQLCLPGRFPPSSLNQIIQDIQRTTLMQCTCRNPVLAANLISIAKGYGSLTGVTLHPNSVVMKAVKKSTKTANLLQLHTPGLIDHLRETCLQIRQTSDQIASKDCESPAVNMLMPKFYERYPMRALQLTDSLQDYYGSSHDHDASQHKLHDKSDSRKQDSRKQSCAEESGYLTHVASAESLKSSTPAISPIKAQPPLPTTTTNQTPEGKQQHIAVSEQSIVDEILDLIRNDLVVDIVQPNKEVAEVGLSELGLDSISHIELRDLLTQSYGIKLTILQIAELNTVKAIAEEVSRQCKSKQPDISDERAVESDKEHKQLSKDSWHQQEREQHLSESGYYTIPSMEELRRLSGDELTHILNFTVGRSGHGKVQFLGETDMSGLDFTHKLVQIEDGSIDLCASSRSTLNKPAVLFYENVLSSETGSTLKEPINKWFESASVQASVVHSDHTNGQLVIKVEQFY